jgi:hypothetical protein
VIIDAMRDGYVAWRYELIDNVTGQRVPGAIWWANDETGVYREYLRGADGAFRLSPETLQPVWEERIWPNGFRFRQLQEVH